MKQLTQHEIKLCEMNTMYAVEKEQLATYL